MASTSLAEARKKRFENDVERLQSVDACSLLRLNTVRRMALSYRDTAVHSGISSDAVALLLRAAVAYLNELYADSYAITCISGKRSTLQLRDVRAAVMAKGPAVLDAPHSDSESDAPPSNH